MWYDGYSEAYFRAPASEEKYIIYITGGSGIMNYEAIKQAAEGYKADMAKFLRDMIAIPSESCEEEGVVKRSA